jgi:hypothetical protein
MSETPGRPSYWWLPAVRRATNARHSHATCITANCRFDGEAHRGPRMKDLRLGEPIVHLLLHALPGEAVLLAALPKRARPEIGHCMPEPRTARLFAGTTK